MRASNFAILCDLYSIVNEILSDHTHSNNVYRTIQQDSLIVSNCDFMKHFPLDISTGC